MDYNYAYMFVTIGIVTVILIGFAVLIPLAVVRKDFDMIQKTPLLFIIETLLVGLLPALPFLFFKISRGLDMHKATTLFWTLAIKFSALHVLFQISGYYAYALS